MLVLKERDYLLELFGQIETYLPEQFCQLKTNLPEPFQQSKTYYKLNKHCYSFFSSLVICTIRKFKGNNRKNMKEPTIAN